MKTTSKESIVFLLLTALITLLAVTTALFGKASWLEAVSFVTGALCVWLVVKENIWNFPIGLVNVTAFSVVFFNARLYADAGLQIVYFILGVMGWYLWLYGGKHRTALTVSRASRIEIIAVLACTALATFILSLLLRQFGGTATFWDALTSSLSLASQWLLNRKRLENWVGWIVVDVIYVPLYLYKELYLTALLYLAFLVMATIGLIAWYRSWRASQTAGVYEERGGVPVP